MNVSKSSGETLRETALSDKELGDAFDLPIGSETIEHLISPGESVLIVVPDATREVGAGQVTNLLVRRLIANGTMPYDISVIIATGLHRKVTREEKESILTPFIVQRLKVFDHDPTDLMGFVRVGETSQGIPVELNRTAVEADHVILIGGINFHYFAGFTGGRKLVCPGIASKRTVKSTHSLAFDSIRKARAEGVGTGELAGNPVHEAFVEAASFVSPAFAFNTFTDEAGKITKVFSGDWKQSHEKACEEYRQERAVSLESKRPLVSGKCRRRSQRHQPDSVPQSTRQRCPRMRRRRDDNPGCRVQRGRRLEGVREVPGIWRQRKNRG